MSAGHRSGLLLLYTTGLLSVLIGCSKSHAPASIVPKSVSASVAASAVQGTSDSAADASEPLYPAKKDGLLGYVNASGRFVITPQFAKALPFDGDRAAVVIGGTVSEFLIPGGEGLRTYGLSRAGFIDRTGRFAVAPRYKCVNRFGSSRYATVARDLTEPKHPARCELKGSSNDPSCRGTPSEVDTECKDWTLIDRSGKEILTQVFKDLGAYYDGDVVAAATVKRTQIARAPVLDCTSPQAHREGNCLAISDRTVRSEDVVRWGYINLSGQWIIPPEYDVALPMRHGRAFVYVQGQPLAIIDTAGVIQARLTNVDDLYGDTVFSEELAPVRTSQPKAHSPQYGYIDTTGRFQIPPQFDDAQEFREGLAAINIAGLWGFIDHAGELVINPSFKRVSSFWKGRAAACLGDGRLAFIDQRGAVVKETSRTCDEWELSSFSGATLDFERQYSDGAFTFDDDRFVESGIGKTTGWTIIESTGKVIYQERTVAIAAGSSAGPRDGPDREESTARSGTAFVVADTGYLLTNAHVVTGCSKVELPAAKTLADVVKTDSSNDLALLRTTSLGNRFARIARPEDLKLGTEIIIFGFPLTGVVASTGNLTTGVVSGTTGLRDDSRFFQLTAPIQPGNSGGPVLNQYGEVLGIASATLDQRKAVAATGNLTQNVNFAIGPSMIRQFLSANGVPLSNPTSWWRFKQEPQEIASGAASFTYLVKCEPSKP